MTSVQLAATCKLLLLSLGAALAAWFVLLRGIRLGKFYHPGAFGVGAAYARRERDPTAFGIMLLANLIGAVCFTAFAVWLACEAATEELIPLPLLIIAPLLLGALAIGTLPMLFGLLAAIFESLSASRMRRGKPGVDLETLQPLRPDDG